MDIALEKHICIWGILQYIILNQPYVSKTLNRLNMQKCALMLKFFESAQKRMDVLYHLLH